MVLLAGCASVGAVQPAHVLGRGKGQLGVALAYQAQLLPGAARGYPMGGLVGRLGVSDRVDVGVHLGPSGLLGETKVQLSGGGPSPGGVPSSVVVSLAPYLGWAGGEHEGAVLRSYHAGLPLLVGVPLGDERQLVLAPRIHGQHLFGSAGSAGGFYNLLYAGGSVGLALRHQRSWIVPELGFLYLGAVTTRRSDGLDGTAWWPNRWTVQASVAVLAGVN